MFFQSLRLSDATVATLYRYGIFILFGILIIESQADITLLPVGIAVRWIANSVFTLLGFSM